MDIFSVITLCGGLGFFLFGMNLLSGGLGGFAGGFFEQKLRRVTASPLRGLLSGAAVTAAVQSSSAVTVILIGLVSSGILTLEGSVGVIMGANIGTTITAWIMSAVGLGDGGLASLLGPGNLASLAALPGLVLFLSSGKRNSAGRVLLGFSVLMNGMELMKNSVEPLAGSDAFGGFLTAFENPLISVPGSALFTAIIQSSSASVGILQALSVAGAISYRAALPAIMGQNIGTCITALLASSGAGRNAARVTAVHVLFNVTGTAVCLAAFCAVSALNPALLDASASPLGIAAAHTAFNVSATAILLPFSGQLVRLSRLIVPEKSPIF